MIFKHHWENYIKEIFMSPIVSESSYQSFTPFVENSFQLHQGMVIIEHFLCPWSGDARLVANVRLCVMSWHCVTMVDFSWVLVSSYDLKVGLWPNLSKIHQFINMASGDIPIKLF
jgi:hypothetical protein